MTGKSDGSARPAGRVPRSMVRSSPREDLRRLHDTCGRPLMPAELADLLGVSERFVAYMLMDAMRSGRVGRLADILVEAIAEQMKNGVAPASLQTVVTPRRDPDSPL